MTIELNQERRQALRFGTVTVGLSLLTRSAMAQTVWPNRPIRWIVPYPPGGQTDIVSRYLGEKLSVALGQQVVIENRAGAQGIVGITAAKQAAANGYTFVYVNSSNFCINVFAYSKLSYSQEDFDPVSQLGEAALGMVVSSASGIRSLEDYVSFVKKSPGKPAMALLATEVLHICMLKCLPNWRSWIRCMLPTKVQGRRFKTLWRV